MSGNLEVHPSESLVFEIVTILIFFNFMICLHPLDNIVKDRHVFIKNANGRVSEEVTVEYFLFNLFDRHLLSDKLLQPHHLEYICFTVLAVESQE